jgi:hypothetical protein
MISIDVRPTFGKYSQRLEVHKRDRIKAAVTAINRAAVSARAHAARELRDEYGGALKVSTIKARMKIKRASLSLPIGDLKFSGRRISLYGNFGMRGIGRWGVRFTRLPWKVETIGGEEVSPDMLQRAFRQRGARRAAVFARRGQTRYPISILVAPGIARALEQGTNKDKVVDRMRERYNEMFEYEMLRRLAGVGR